MISLRNSQNLTGFQESHHVKLIAGLNDFLFYGAINYGKTDAPC
jgi:hypothetical protein